MHLSSSPSTLGKVAPDPLPGAQLRCPAAERAAPVECPPVQQESASTHRALVSVVIPTRDRSDLVGRAIRSVLTQTHTQLDVIVVVDGPDDVTEQMLRGISEPRLRWLVNHESVGGAHARNVGVRAAKGRWIAFLDDDDEWLPSKLERQLALLARTDQPTVASCQIITRTPRAEYVAPTRGPRPGEPLSEYLFRAREPFGRGARLQTSALVLSRDLALAVPWDSSVRRFQDFDWMLRLAAGGARFVVVPEALCVWYFRQDRPTIGSRHAADWRQALEWIEQRRHLVTRRAYARWILGRVVKLAAASGEGVPVRLLWSQARRNGTVGAMDALRFVVYLVRHSVRRLIRRNGAS